MAQEIAFAAPRAEELTRVAVGGIGAGITGLVSGVIVKVAPQVGAAAPILTWGTLLGAPLLGGFGALFTRGMLGDLFQGIACGGLGVIGFSLPGLMAPITGRKALTPDQIALMQAGGGVKQLPPGALYAPQRAQTQAAVGLEF